MRQGLKIDVTNSTSTYSTNSISQSTKAPEYRRVAGSSLTKSVTLNKQSPIFGRPRESTSQTDIKMEII